MHMSTGERTLHASVNDEDVPSNGDPRRAPVSRCRKASTHFGDMHPVAGIDEKDEIEDLGIGVL
jgi:hypothetical protein